MFDFGITVLLQVLVLQNNSILPTYLVPVNEFHPLIFNDIKNTTARMRIRLEHIFMNVKVLVLQNNSILPTYLVPVNEFHPLVFNNIKNTTATMRIRLEHILTNVNNY